MKSEYDQQAESFLERNGLTFRATLSNTKTAPWKSESEKSGNHYRITISRKGAKRAGYQGNKRLVFDFWGSIADKDAGREWVSAYDVLACISGDAYTPETFKDFCSEFGYDDDSIQAMQTFNRCNRFAKRLREFFTEKELNELQEIQ